MIWYDTIPHNLISMIRIRHLVNSKNAEKHTRTPWPTSAGRTGSLLFGLMPPKDSIQLLALWSPCLVGCFLMPQGRSADHIDCPCGGVGHHSRWGCGAIGWMRIFEGIFSSGDSLDDMVPTSGRSHLEQTGCRSQLHGVVRIPDPFIHPELASPWPDSSKLQAPSEVACSQSFWLENWSENDDHQNQSQWRTRHRFAMCTLYTCDICIPGLRWIDS